MKILSAAALAACMIGGATSLANAQAYEQLANPALSAQHPASEGNLGITLFPQAPLTSGRSAYDGRDTAPVPQDRAPVAR